MAKENFIRDQRWSLLTDFENPRQWIEQIIVRSQAVPTVGDESNPAPDAWVGIPDHYEVVRNDMKVPAIGSVDLSRFVFTTDSGLGKSIAMEWIWAAVNHPETTRAISQNGKNANTADASQPGPSQSGWLAFNIPRHVLIDGTPQQVHDRLFQFMIDDIVNRVASTNCDHTIAQKIVDRHRRTGRLMLLFDGLDHLNNANALAEVLASKLWQDCSIGLGGRPFALKRYWDDLFAQDNRWRFIRLEPFTKEQQKTFLTEEKWDAVNERARHLLAIPRVIKYVHSLPEVELRKLTTAADVFYGAVRTMVIQGLTESVEARKITGESTLPDGPTQGAIETALRLLSAIAFEMVSDRRQRAIKDEDGNVTGYEHARPNFDRVEPGEMPTFRQKIASLTRLDEKDFDRCWEGLSALNNGVLNGFFDSEVTGLKLIQYSNRGLQEFLCAYWLAQYCNLDKDGKIAEGANDFLWEWIYLPLEPESHDYYDIWTYLAEMPTDPIMPAVWLESLAPVYSPARFPEGKYGDPEHRETKRSNEIIFRSWNRFEQLIDKHPRAHQIREGWWGEFESKILAGDYGHDAKVAAVQLTKDFVTFRPGKVRMGIPDEKTGGIPEFEQKLFEGMLERQSGGESPSEVVKSTFANWDFGVGDSADIQKSAWENFSLRVLADNSMERVEEQFAIGKDEHWHQVEIEESFQLARRPCTNQWYRLYQQGHGQQTLIASKYLRRSQTPDHPAIYISFVDAWAICQWLRWREADAKTPKSCQLPWEDWWEYACKFGSDPKYLYWWDSDDPDSQKMTFESHQTTTADPNHANPKTRELDPDGIGVMEMSGNVWEHCLDQWQRSHEKSRDAHIGDMARSRVVRGGAYFDQASDCASAFRFNWLPSYLSRFFGVRFSRAQ